jgi:hypothetical protein
MKVISKYDNGLKKYPSFLYVISYKGKEMLVMEQDLQITKPEVEIENIICHEKDF